MTNTRTWHALFTVVASTLLASTIAAQGTTPPRGRAGGAKVTGSKVTIYTVPTILAGMVVKGADTLLLRDVNGMPVWRGMRRP